MPRRIGSYRDQKTSFAIRGEMIMKPSAIAFAIVAMVAYATPAHAGRLEDAMDRFNQVQSSYAELKSNIDSGNIDSAKSSSSKLNDDTSKVCAFTKDVKDRIYEIPSLQGTWSEVSNWCLELGIRTAELTGKLGTTNPSDQMSKVTEAYLKLGESLKASYDKFREFGRNWAVICSDLCR